MPSDLAPPPGPGVKLLLADLDNTLAPYGVAEPDDQVREWKEALAAAGITLFILSNSRGPAGPAVCPGPGGAL